MTPADPKPPVRERRQARGLKRTPMNRVSPSRAAEMVGYGEQRDAAVGDGRQPCQIVSPVCTRYVEHLHEPLSRGTRWRADGCVAWA